MSGIGSLKFAQDRVAEYAQEVLAAHDEAMECRECETLLQLGIDAFNWLMLVDRQVREGMFQYGVAFDPGVDSAIKQLCRAWLKAGDAAEKRVEVHLARGFQVENLPTFRECCAEMAAIVESFDDAPAMSLPPAMIDLRDGAVREHHDGQTSEFI